MYVRSYDSAAPQHIPSGSTASYYVNGFVWPRSEIDRMSRVYGVSVRREAGWARYARSIDVETGAALLEDVVPFLQERHRLGHRDGTVYASLSIMPEVVARCKAANVYVRLHVAAWDKNPDFRPVVDGTASWSKQFDGNDPRGYDISVIYGKNDLVRPNKAIVRAEIQETEEPALELAEITTATLDASKFRYGDPTVIPDWAKAA